jgi:molecular chaperone DnaK
VAKRALSTASDTVLTIPVLAGQPRQLKIDRARLAASAAGLLAQAQGTLDRVLADAGQTAAAVQQILLVGGMTRAPMVRELVGERFGRAFTQVVGPDEAIALGAAIQGLALARPRRR